jgi:hypothetical protein
MDGALRDSPADLWNPQLLVLSKARLLAGGRGIAGCTRAGHTHIGVLARVPRPQVLAGNIGPALPAGLGFSLGAAVRTGHRTIVLIVSGWGRGGGRPA